MERDSEADEPPDELPVDSVELPLVNGLTRPQERVGEWEKGRKH